MIDSNAEQFARMGHPWTGEPAPKLKVSRKIRKAADKPKPAPVRAYAVLRSEADESFIHTKCKLDMRARMRAHAEAHRAAHQPVPAPAQRVYIAPSETAKRNEQAIAAQLALDALAAERRRAADIAERGATRFAARFTELAADYGTVMAEALAD